MTVNRVHCGCEYLCVSRGLPEIHTQITDEKHNPGFIYEEVRHDAMSGPTGALSAADVMQILVNVFHDIAQLGDIRVLSEEQLSEAVKGCVLGDLMKRAYGSEELADCREQEVRLEAKSPLGINVLGVQR